ncbi:hypothetical protein JW865_06290 [Candidatus Bathyarchaeota archaeon]|nr:hypothetical protein [Candidatus Bathyarchaeota archaeon]
MNNLLKIKFLLIFSLIFSSNIEFYVYTNDACLPCVDRYDFVKNLYSDFNFVKYDLSNKENLDNFNNLLNILDDVLLSVPIYGIFNDDKLQIIVAGEINEESWNNIFKFDEEGIQVYVGGAYQIAELKTIITDINKIKMLEDIFRGNVISIIYRDLSSLLIPVSIAAIMDAVNPCAISILLVILSLLYHSPERKFILKTGAAYSSAVFLTYLLMGLGFLQIFSNITILRYVLFLIPIFFGILNIYDFFAGERKHVPESFSKIINKYIEKVSNPSTGFIAGMVTAILVLPCSSAPYFLVLNLLSETSTKISGFILLAIYNLIIVTPFIIITLGIHTLRLQTIDMRLWVSENRRWINLIVGIGLILLSLYSIFS